MAEMSPERFFPLTTKTALGPCPDPSNSTTMMLPMFDHGKAALRRFIDKGPARLSGARADHNSDYNAGLNAALDIIERSNAWVDAWRPRNDTAERPGEQATPVVFFFAAAAPKRQLSQRVIERTEVTWRMELWPVQLRRM